MSTNIPQNLKYTKEHEWALIEGDIVTVGITDFAQSSLGDIVFVELPEVGATLTKDNTFGVVESIKSVSDLYSPITGEVIESNADIVASPELINQNAYDSWLIKVKITNKAETNSLLDASTYKGVCEGAH